MINILIPTTKDRRERLAKCIEAIRASVCTEPITVSTYENADGGFIAAIHKMLEPLKDEAIVFCIGDDVIVDKNCLQELFNAFSSRKHMSKAGQSFVIQPFDEFHDGKISVNPFTEAWVMKRYQYKGYIHNYADVEFTELIKERKMYVYFPQAKVEHVHYLNKKAAFDKTYKGEAGFNDHDKNLFHKRAAAGFKPLNP